MKEQTKWRDVPEPRALTNEDRYMLNNILRFGNALGWREELLARKYGLIKIGGKYELDN